MNLMRKGVLLVRLGVLVIVGCTSLPPFPESSLTGRVVEVQVGQSLTPQKITVKEGDEVKWVNTTSLPVDIAFDQSLDGVVSCQRGFVSTGWGYLFGGSEPDFLLIAQVHSRDSASLCLSTPGTYTYHVHVEQATTGTAPRIAGTITIE
jgi:plastocyanin